MKNDNSTTTTTTMDKNQSFSNEENTGESDEGIEKKL